MKSDFHAAINVLTDFVHYTIWSFIEQLTAFIQTKVLAPLDMDIPGDLNPDLPLQTLLQSIKSGLVLLIVLSAHAPSPLFPPTYPYIYIPPLHSPLLKKAKEGGK